MLVDFLYETSTNRLFQPKHDATGKQVIEIASHFSADMALVMEFIYGAGMIDKVESPSELFFISDCIEIYGLGRDFEISCMAEYAVNYLGKYLNTKLKEICVFPTQREREALLKHGFLQFLNSDIWMADRVRKSGEGRELPYKMLVDFVVAGRGVILRNEDIQPCISQDVLPPDFTEEAMLTQCLGYQTEWMQKIGGEARDAAQ